MVNGNDSCAYDLTSPTGPCLPRSSRSWPPATYVDEDRKPAFFSHISPQPKIIHRTKFHEYKLGENSNYINIPWLNDFLSLKNLEKKKKLKIKKN